jgi:hypothetical protein
MATYYVPIHNIAGKTGSGQQDAYKTLAAIVVPDTADIEVAIMEVDIGPAGDAGLDENFTLSIWRIDNPGTAGTSTNIAASALKDLGPHTDLPAPDWDAEIDYSVEPGTFGTYPLCPIGMNDRGGFFKRFFSVKEAPQARQDQVLYVRIQGHASAPGANAWSGQIIVEDRF